MTKGTICWSVCVLLLLAASTTDARRTISSKSLRYQTERVAESHARAETDLSNFEQHVNNAQRDGNQFNTEDQRAEEEFINAQSSTPASGALLEVDPPKTPAPVNLTELAIRCPGDCSGNGFCLGTECFCKDGFDGLDCSKRVCVNNCSGNGVCDNGRCKCQEGWYGLLCDTAGCPKNCHFNGACHSGSCVCFDGYTGILCEDVVGCARNCSGHGECKNHRCYCREGFAGKICEERLCPKNCNGRGECDAKTGKCTCKAGKFHGDDCSLFYCPNDCSGNGKCNVTTGRCKCNPGFHGADCSPLNCYLDCSERGKCVPGIGNSSKAVCKCQRGWTGDGCEKEVCPQNCNEREYKGVCTFKGCKCNATWTGPSCTVPRCPYDCTAPDHGVCDTSKMQCNCLHGWSGPACNQRTCPSMCSYRGACNNGTCVCRDWWSGPDCDIPVCKNNCSRHGECVLPDMSAYNAELNSEAEGGVQKVPAKIKVARARCECDQGWGGVDCGKKLCPRDCLGRGVCNGGVCFCDKGYYGEDCSVKETVDTGSKTVTPEIAARMLCENYCNHGKCFPVPPKANASIFRLNPAGELTTIAQNATVHYECFCEPKWAGPACNQSLIKCPANCLDKKGVCRKDCQFLNKNPCPYFNGRMCGGPGRGKCNGSTGECKCKSPFHGPDCGTASCPNNCSGHGMCNTKTMKCLCFGGWTGDNCNTALQD